MDLLRHEIGNVVLEGILLSQQGEARKAVEAAVVKRRRVEDVKVSSSESSPRPQQTSRRAPPRPLGVQLSAPNAAEDSKYVRGRSLSL